MSDAFSNANADFTNLSPVFIGIYDVLHNTAVEMDESGIAVTIILSKCLSLMRAQVRILYCLWVK